MEKLRRVLSGQDDEEQGLTAQVAGRGGDGRGLAGRGPVCPPPGKNLGSFPGFRGVCRSLKSHPTPRFGLPTLGDPCAAPAPPSLGLPRVFCAALFSRAGQRGQVGSAGGGQLLCPASCGKPSSKLRRTGVPAGK